MLLMELVNVIIVEMVEQRCSIVIQKIVIVHHDVAWVGSITVVGHLVHRYCSSVAALSDDMYVAYAAFQNSSEAATKHLYVIIMAEILRGKQEGNAFENPIVTTFDLRLRFHSSLSITSTFFVSAVTPTHADPKRRLASSFLIQR